MNKFLKLYKKLLSQGFATAEEKKELASMAKDVEGSEEAVSEVNALPDTDPATKVEEEKEVQEQLEKMMGEATKSIKADFEKKVSESVDSKVKEIKDAMEKKAGIYAQEGVSDRKALNEKTREIVKALFRNDNAVLSKYLGTTTNASAAFLVDSEMATEIQRLSTEYGVARREMRVVTLSKHTLDIPTALTDVTVNWTDEAAVKTSSIPTFARPSLSLKKITAIVPFTDELLEDEEFDLFQYVSENVAEKMAEKEDLAFFTGDGTSIFGSFTGLLADTTVNEVVLTGTTFASMTADDLLDMQDSTHSGALANGKYYMHRSIKSHIRTLKDTQGLYVYQAPSAADPATVWGKPVVFVEVMPAISDSAADTSFVLFGDLKRAAWLGTKASGMTMAVSTEASVRNVANNADINLFTQDMTALRFVERIGYVVVLAGAITKLTTAAASA